MERDQYTFKELAELINGLPKRYSQKIIAVDGLSGSGKKLFVQALRTVMSQSAVIHAEDFMKLESERSVNLEGTVSPNIDWDRFDQEIFTPLRFGNPVVYQKYDSYTNSLGAKNTISTGATIIVEGEYVTQNRFAQSYDFKIWIEATGSVRMTRILEREGEKKWKEWQETLEPVEHNYVEREKQNLRADIVINGNKADFKEGYYGVLKL